MTWYNKSFVKFIAIARLPLLDIGVILQRQTILQYFYKLLM